MCSDNTTHNTLYAFSKVTVVDDVVLLDVHSVWAKDATDCTKAFIAKYCTRDDDNNNKDEGVSYNYIGCNKMIHINGGGAMNQDFSVIKRVFVNVYLPITAMVFSPNKLTPIIALVACTIAGSCRFHYKNIDINKCAFMVHSQTDSYYCNALYVENATQMNTRFQKTNLHNC